MIDDPSVLWLSQEGDPNDPRRGRNRRFRWPWTWSRSRPQTEPPRGSGSRRRISPWLLLLLPLLLALLIIGAGFVLNENESDATAVPPSTAALPTPTTDDSTLDATAVPAFAPAALPTPTIDDPIPDEAVVRASIQEALPTLMMDNSIIVYVVDDSGSLNRYLGVLRQVLQEVSQKQADSGEIAMLIYGDYPTRWLFEFTDSEDAPWESAIYDLTAASENQRMYQALDEARQMLVDKPGCPDNRSAGAPICLQKSIVLVGDGDTAKLDALRREAVIRKLTQSNIAVNTIHIGRGNEDALQTIASRTGGTFIRVR